MPEIFDTDITLSPSWLQVLDEEFKQSYFVSLCDFIRREKKSGKVIYPPQENIFNAFNSAPFESVKVVIIGQDPYHGAGQAHGLSFSVPSGVAIPPSLKNIYKELVDDCGVPMPECGNLKSWTEQGVLLLNATLTVEQGNAGAHQGQGWEKFTDSVISKLSEQREGLVFFLWGAFAQKKENLINANKHFLIKSAHPSPLSAYRGFLGSKPFSQANNYLKKTGKQTVDWQLPNLQKSLF